MYSILIQILTWLLRHECDWHSFRALVKLVPELKQQISEPNWVAQTLYYTHVRELIWPFDLTLAHFSLQLIHSANDAGSDDRSCVKPKVAEWINAQPGIPDEQNLTLSTRDGRGLQHDITGRLLCLIKYDWDDLRQVTMIPSRALITCDGSWSQYFTANPCSVHAKMRCRIGKWLGATPRFTCVLHK